MLIISTEPQLQNDGEPSSSGELEVKFQLAKDTLETMLKTMYSIRDQLSNAVSFFFVLKLALTWSDV